jgi:hypothetical protein
MNTDMSKQTAVEWLIDQIKEYDIAEFTDKENWVIKMPAWILTEKEEQAKAMEKEQMINTWTEATAPDHEIGLSDAFYIISQVKKAEQYYNETYGGDK